jgi:hypothetical protein
VFISRALTEGVAIGDVKTRLYWSAWLLTQRRPSSKGASSARPAQFALEGR